MSERRAQVVKKIFGIPGLCKLVYDYAWGLVVDRDIRTHDVSWMVPPIPVDMQLLYPKRVWIPGEDRFLLLTLYDIQMRLCGNSEVGISVPRHHARECVVVVKDFNNVLLYSHRIGVKLYNLEAEPGFNHVWSAKHTLAANFGLQSNICTIRSNERGLLQIVQYRAVEAVPKPFLIRIVVDQPFPDVKFIAHVQPRLWVLSNTSVLLFVNQEGKCVHSERTRYTCGLSAGPAGYLLLKMVYDQWTIYDTNEFEIVGTITSVAEPQWKLDSQGNPELHVFELLK